MTATGDDARARRWPRVAVPFAVLLALLTATLIGHASQRPDPADAAYLSPLSDAGVGAGRLAARLRERGVTVDRQTTVTGAVTALWRGGDPATLFVTTPDLIDLDPLGRYGALPPGTRVVVVAPPARALDGWSVALRDTRWTTAVAEPGCADEVAAGAGPAAVRWRRYDADGAATCYGGALVTVTSGGVTITVAGAADPFRNDRIAEHGNAALAVGLLARTGRVVWLDRHRREAPPEPSPSATASGPVPRRTGASTGPPQPAGTPEHTRDGPVAPPPAAARKPNPLAEAFPAALWASLALAALALLALAAAAARRLGAPVAEPLPSRVPANETMLGHARLYQRARARGASLDILRAGARRRLTVHLGLPADAGVARIAEQAGRDADEVHGILAGPAPRDDAELVAAAVAVRALVREITGTEGEQP
ncbi:DUF4350 domain-containing protein [Actinoplanes teichomyceticus]|uniref:DUF4350 domain-containing protein n=1 Tax=Actinoplanes teichomyceticus TaxID=1867 RepID=A0A561VMA0_ACTTI|nr:DUF4350 domain-containing protein [Actinoplanes teichomyceticus]TWG12713.1 hypothetical protein FHX34_105581 [Actinoplanes teichomyceticus]GIF13446.1 hypothetical protein Ate01nite_34780 [Actinoplanes teichomyceticus]